jgi:acyl-ACP thioesterase
METNDKKTIQRLSVPCYDTDSACYLTPGAFMNMAQEIAYVSARSLGFGFDELAQFGTAWVLSRMHVEFPATPRWRDTVELQTWHKGFEGPFYVRDFRMLDADGNPAVLATSSWLIIDMETRRLLRREHLADRLPLDTECAESALPEACGKVVMPAGPLEEMAEHRVSYSDVDLVGHANNARYVVWAMDCLDFEEVTTRRVRSLRINFNKEVYAGETVELFRAPVEGGWVVEGRVGDRSSFCVEILFA